MKKDNKHSPDIALIIELADKKKGQESKDKEEEDPEVELMRAMDAAKDPAEKASLLKDFIALCLMRKEEAEAEGEEY